MMWWGDNWMENWKSWFDWLASYKGVLLRLCVVFKKNENSCYFFLIR